MNRKITAFVLASCVAVGQLGGIGALAEENIPQERYVLDETFEGKTGTVTDIGGISYSGVNSNISVDVDELTGSEALKFVVDDKGNSLTLSLGRPLSEGKYKASFDFRAQNHSKNITRFGQPINTNKATETFPEIAAGYIWYYELGKQPSNYTVKYEKVKDTIKNRYAKIEYIFDASNRTFDMYRDGILLVDNQAYYRTGSAAADVEALWFVFNDNTKNGTDKDGTEENLGVYWLDNFHVEQLQAEPAEVIPAKDLTSVDVRFLTPVKNVTDMIALYRGDDKIPASAQLSTDGCSVTLTPDFALDEYTPYKIVAKSGLASADEGTLDLTSDTEYMFTTAKKIDDNVIYAECFEDYDVGKKYWDFGDNAHSGIIEVDPITNSKALKLVVDGTSVVSQLVKIPADKIPTKGKYRVSYSVRAKTPQASDTTYAYMNRFPNIINSKYGVDATGGALCGSNSPKNKYFYFVSHTEHNGFAANMENGKETYMNCSYIMDLDNKTYDSEANGTYLTDYTMWGASSGRIADVAGYWFELTPAADGNIGEYYIDNLVVEKEPIKVLKTVPENNSRILTSEDEIRIKLNMPINNEIENYVEVYNGEQLLEADADYTLSFDNAAHEVTISFNNLKKYAEYSVIIRRGITANNGLTLEKDYTYNFTTAAEADFKKVKLCDDENEYASLAECAGKTVKAYADINISADLSRFLIVAVKDNYGVLKVVKTVKDTEFADNAAETELTIPTEASADWTAEFMLWSGLDTLRPLCKPGCIGVE